MYREGCKNTNITKTIQDVVGVTADGIWGPQTTAAVKVYQTVHNLLSDGIVGTRTLGIMGILDTDTTEQYYTTENGLLIHKHFLPPNEYIQGEFKNDYAFIHHTAGWNDPYKVINSWGRDNRGRVATEFVLGGQKITDNNEDYDGVMVQAFPDGNQAWHLGPCGSAHMVRHSVALEICSFGYLKDGKTYVGTQANSDQISVITDPFRGHTEWHKYSDKQLTQTKLWIEFVAERDNIDLSVGLIPWIKERGAKAFEFNQAAYMGEVKGLLTHTNINKQKSDNFPQPELIDMLLSL